MPLPSVCSHPLQPIVPGKADARHEDEGCSLRTTAQCSSLRNCRRGCRGLQEVPVLTAQPRLAVDSCSNLDLHPGDQPPACLISSMIDAGRQLAWIWRTADEKLPTFNRISSPATARPICGSKKGSIISRKPRGVFTAERSAQDRMLYYRHAGGAVLGQRAHCWTYRQRRRTCYASCMVPMILERGFEGF